MLSLGEGGQSIPPFLRPGTWAAAASQKTGERR